MQVQQTTYCCGPTALYNAIVWSNGGWPIDTSIYHRLVEKSKCPFHKRTQEEDFRTCIDWLQQEWKIHVDYEILYPSFEDIKQHCKNDTTAIILLYHWEDRKEGRNGEHYVLLYDYPFKAINNENKTLDYPLIEQLTDDQVKTMLRAHDRFPIAWTLTRTKK